MEGDQQLYTCISCAVAFADPALQRQHFATDWHRYNMKRRVASLPPVSALNFNQKVLERREQTAVRPDPRDMQCGPCKKAFLSENAYRSHMASKKHRTQEAKVAEAAASSSRLPVSEEPQAGPSSEVPSAPVTFAAPEAVTEEEDHPDDDAPSTSANPNRLIVEQDASEQDVEMSIDAKIAASRRQLSASDCLFCTHKSASVEASMDHMSRVHSFFIPDSEFLVDLPGLLTYLGEKLAVGNVCLYCPNGGKEFGSLEAVRGHMRDRAHCKLAYDTEEDRLEISDYYDFSSTHADSEGRKSKKKTRSKGKFRATVEETIDEEDDEWEAADSINGDEADEVLVVEGESEDDGSSDEEEDSDSEFEDDTGVTLGADGLSLRLPSGRTLGHRSLRIYYQQNFRPIDDSVVSKTTALTTKLRNIKKQLEDPTQALIPVSGGSGGYGKGLQVMKARNAGEARYAKKVARQHRDLRAIADHKTRVAFVHNSQKHFRDPLLQ